MAIATDSRPAVYHYSDPAFPWDLASAIGDLDRRGFRVVTGDNADELLFLMQMGRPVAIIYTLPRPEARAHAAFQMIARRAADMLVPMIIAGPENPRDGLLVRYPSNGAIEESHAPFHSIGDLVERFDSDPPSTPSRPPMVVANQTFGKGRTMMAWRRDGPIVTPADYGASQVEPQPEAKPPSPAPATDERGERKTLPRKKKHAGAGSDAPADPASAPSAAAARAEEPVRAVRFEPAAETARRPPSRSRGRSAWKIPAALAGGVAIGVVGLVVYLATAPGRPAEAARPGAAAAPRPPVAAPPVGARPPRPDGAAGDRAATPPPVDDGAAPGSAARRTRAAAEEPAAEDFLTDASGAVRFPGHFREQSAVFWFAGDWEERRFLDLVRSLGPTARIRVIGHSTPEELAAGLHNLALSRAWAVEKYLVREGIADDRIDTEKGGQMTVASDVDDRGWPRNRWVDVRFD
jgi:hypothetical protein